MSLKPYCEVAAGRLFVIPNEDPPRLREKPRHDEPAQAFYSKGTHGVAADELRLAADPNDKFACDSSLMVIELEMGVRKRGS